MKLCNLEIQGKLFNVIIYDIFFLLDLKSYLVNTYNGLSNIHNIATDIMDDNLVSYLKIYVLWHADDRILLAE